MFPDDLLSEAEHLLADLRRLGLRLATAESCTGGLIAGLLTEIPGASDVVERGWVTYSNAAKTDCLGVDSDLIAKHGAVSAEVARAMAQGALGRSRADVAVAVTGVAGPGGSAEKPAGLVYLAAAGPIANTFHRECRFGDVGRHRVRVESVRAALALVRAVLDAHSTARP